MAFAINSRNDKLPNSLIKGVKIGKEELNSICGKIPDTPEEFNETELRKPANKSRVMQVIWKNSTGFESTADNKAHAAEFKGIEQRMDNDCAIFRFIESPDGRASDQPYFIPLAKIETGDVKIDVEFFFDPDELLTEWLQEHGTQKQRRISVKQESKGGSSA
jgi:hypothetical protein